MQIRPAFLLLLLPFWLSAAARADTAPSLSPQIVTVGVYLDHVPELDLKANSFVADFYLWFVWKGNIDPTQTVEFTNVLNPQELSKVPANVDSAGNSKPEILPDGRSYQSFHVQGHFWHPFPIGNYPFDEQDIVLSLEDSRHSSSELIYRVDTKETAIRPGLSIPGWELGKIDAVSDLDRFPTNFGDPRVSPGADLYSQAKFTVHANRPQAGLVLKTMVPVLIIMLITLGAFFCSAEDIDARLCLTITALISAVALQYSTSTELPPTGYLLLIDKIYLLTYAIILGTTFLSIVANRLHAQGKSEEALRLNMRGFAANTALFFGGTIFFALNR
jgi:hypothetical protein